VAVQLEHAQQQAVCATDTVGCVAAAAAKRNAASNKLAKTPGTPPFIPIPSAPQHMGVRVPWPYPAVKRQPSAAGGARRREERAALCVECGSGGDRPDQRTLCFHPRRFEPPRDASTASCTTRARTPSRSRGAVKRRAPSWWFSTPPRSTARPPPPRRGSRSCGVRLLPLAASTCTRRPRNGPGAYKWRATPERIEPPGATHRSAETRRFEGRNVGFEVPGARVLNRFLPVFRCLRWSDQDLP